MTTSDTKVSMAATRITTPAATMSMALMEYTAAPALSVVHGIQMFEEKRTMIGMGIQLYYYPRGGVGNAHAGAVNGFGHGWGYADQDGSGIGNGLHYDDGDGSGYGYAAMCGYGYGYEEGAGFGESLQFAWTF